MIKYEWIILLAAGIISYLVIKKQLKHEGEFQKSFLDALINSAFLYFIVYKFSIILIRPSIIIENPLGILYFTGGLKGYIIAGIACVLYLGWTYKNRNWPFRKVVHALGYSIVTFLLAFLAIRTLFILIL